MLPSENKEAFGILMILFFFIIERNKAKKYIVSKFKKCSSFLRIMNTLTLRMFYTVQSFYPPNPFCGMLMKMAENSLCLFLQSVF